MSDFECPGLPADWINGWLAAVGITVLDARVRLRWSTDGTPVAVLSAADVDPVEAIVESWPDVDLLKRMPIARNRGQTELMERHVHVDVFRQRVRIAREHPYSWTLSSTMTDLQVGEHGLVEHAPFDPSGPGSTKWLHDRLMGLHKLANVSRERVQDSLAGRAVREQHNGLGFDISRLGSLADENKRRRTKSQTIGGIRVDPVVEVLAFFGLAVLPMRANGVDKRLAPRADGRSRQRGWRRSQGRGEEARRFAWPAWTQPLDCHGIDALLDAWVPGDKSAWPLLGVRAGWQTVGFKPRGGQSDPTKAFGKERL